MIGKNNKKLKELKQGVKVETYSIKKFKFGAASIVIGASIFFGTGVASANEIAASTDSSDANSTNAKSGNDDKLPEKINTVSAGKESVASVNKPSNVKEESTKVEVEKKVVDKSLLETSITKLEELLATVNKDKAPASTLSAVNVDLINAKSILENANATQEEVDALVKKLKQQTQIVSSMPKVTAKEKEVKEGANTIANSGSRDPRNGQSMGEGTGERAATVSSRWTNQNNLLIYQRFRATDGNGNRRNDDRQFTENKVDMTARTQMIDGQKYLVYDVFFNNDGQSMVGLSRQQLYNVLLPSKIIDLNSDGSYKSDDIRDLYFETYRRKNQNEGGTLSQNPDKFRYESTQQFHFLNDHDKSKGALTYLYNVGVRQSRDSFNKDLNQYFKNNRDDQFLKDASTLDGVHKKWSYGIGVRTNDATAAVHMHFKLKLRPGVTDEEIQKAFTLAIAGTYGPTTKQSYVFGSGKKDNENVQPTRGEKQAKLYPIKGSSHTKVVGEKIPNTVNPVNPVADNYITLKGSGEFPSGMNWSWKGNSAPSTEKAGKFIYTAIARYEDGSTSEDPNSGSDGKVYFTVNPQKPRITTSVMNKKGLTNQTIEVNVGSGVKDGSVVKLYDGDRVIGQGTSNGTTARITVSGALPGNPLKAETTVDNGGVVVSEKSDSVTPTEAPDTQRPTVTISPAKKEVEEGKTVTFTVTARDDKSVTIDPADFLKQYGDRLVSNDNVKITKTEKVTTITIRTKKEDIGKSHTITFGAHDDAGNKAEPATFTFTVTPADNQKPSVEVGGIRLTEKEPQSAQFYVYRGATFNPTVKAWDDSGNITSMSVEGLPKGSQAPTYTAQTGKTEANPYATPLSTGKVLDTQTLGDHVARFQISDGKNNATYLMKYKVVDVVAEHTENNVKLNSKSGDPNVYLNTAGEQDGKGNPVVGPQADVHFPAGMNFRWDKANGSTTNVTLDKVGKQTHKAIAVFPKNPGNRNGIPVFAPETAERNIVFNVADDQKPKASLNGVELSETANEPIFTVYRGATFNPELKVSDNSGVISKVEVKGGLPKGVTPGSFTVQTGKTEATPYAPRLSSGTVLNTETLGVHESTIHVEGSSPSDSRDFKFKYRVVDIETRNLENGIANVPVASTLNKANSPKNIDAHHYLKVVDSEDKADRGNNYLPSGMTWTWKDRNGTNLDPGTTLDNSGKYTRTATAIFPGTKANNITDANSTTRTTFAPAEIKRQVILAVTPTAPIVEGKENGSVTITPPTRPNSTDKQDIDKITITYVPTGKTTPETVTVTKSGNNWTVNGKTPDKVSVTPEGVVTISDAEVADKTEVTAKVSKNVDNNTLESPVARGTANGPLAAEVTNPAPVPEKAPVTPVTVVTPNKPGSSITVDGPVNGLTVDEEGKLKGKPEVNDWKPKEEEREITIPVKVTKGGETVTVNVPVPILRDTDGDGIPDKEDSDDDNDGIPDTEEEKNGTNPKVVDKLTGTTVEKTVPEKKPVPAGTKVITPNKPGTTITTDKPVNGLTVDNGGNLVGTPTVDDWGPNEEERKVEIPVKLKKGTEEVVVKVPVKVQRDTDGDGIPDVKDSDDDNDGIPDTEDANPKVADNLTGTTVEKTVPEKKPVPAGTKVITPNKPDTTITTDKPVNGLTVDNGGNLVGTPTVDDWGPNEEERKVEIPVKLKKGTEEVVVKVPVKVQRDTDGDGIPDVKDSDDDNDGIPDTEDANPKVADNLTGTTVEKTVPEKKPVPAGTKVITPNKPDTTITTDKPVNGLTVDNGGNLVGTPTVDDWGPNEEERKVEIPVKLKKGTEEVVVKVPVKVQRDTDGDGIPDVKDSDDDNDGIPDTEDANPKVADNLTGTTVEKTVPEKKPVPAGTKVITPNKPDTTITTDKPVNGLTVDNGGNLVGTPTVDDWGPNEEERKVEIPVKLKKGTEEVVVKVPVKIQRDTDGDGIPDVKDSDDDNDGIPDEEEIKNGTDPKTPTTQTPTIEITQQPNGNAIVTPKKPDGKPYPPGTKVEIPGENGTPITVTIGDNGSGEVPNDNLPKKAVPGTGTVTEPNKGPSKPVDVTTPAHKTPKLELNQDPETGDVTVTPKKPDGSPYKPGTKVEIPGKDGKTIPVTIGEDGKGKVPNADLPEGKVPGTGKITEPGKPTEEVPVETPSKIIPGAPTTEQPVEIKIDQKPNGDAVVTPKKPDGSTYPKGSKVEIPGEDKDGNPITITVTIGDNGSGEVPNDDLPKKAIPGKGRVTEPKKNPSNPIDVTTPAHKTPSLDVKQDPKTGDVTVTPKRPDGSTYPPGTTVEIPGKDKDHPITVTTDENGKAKVPNADLPKDKVPGTGKITEPGKPTEEVPVETPAHKTPSLEVEQDPKTGDVTVTPKRPDGSTYPPGTTVEIPGKDKDHPITVTTDENGKAKVPNADLPKDKVPGTGKITEPGKPTEEVPVETPAHKTPSLDVEQDPKTGDVIVTPKRPDGSTYPPGTTVEIPGKDKDHPITVTTDENGKAKVPNADLPKDKVPGTGKITEPGKPTEEVPVETPAHKTPSLDVEQDPKTGDVIVTPKRPDGSTYPPGTTVEIPGKDKDHPITVTTDENGKAKVPNADLPKDKVPGTGKITEPGRPTEEVPVETPAHKTPSLDVEQDPKTGDVTVTPKRPDGSTYPPGTTVEIPGKDKDHPITVTTDENGKAKVPNADLPKDKVPGTGKITEPGRPTEEVPVETPAHKTPSLDVEQDPKTGDVTVTPKRPDGSTYPPGTTVEIPGKDKDHPITVTTDENGKAKVPNADLPKDKVPGTGKITEPGRPTEEVPVETPAHKTPSLDVEQDPKTGDVTVTPKRPDGSTYPPGTTVEIPGKDKDHPITVTTDDNGKAKVPNTDLPEGKVPGTGKITEPGRPTEEVPVETPAHKTPTLDVEQDPKTGDVIVTPKRPDGSTYPPGTTVEIPGKDKDHPITVTTDENGKAKVPNADLPKDKVPGTGKITEPGRSTEEVPNVTTPAHKTPTLDVERDPKTGDVTVTPKKPDGSTYPPGTKVKIPGENGTPIEITIGEDGKGKVPNDKLPKKEVPGTGKITEPGKPTEEVPNVTTPGKYTPETPETEQPGKIEIDRKPNGDAIVTPKKPDGSTYPPGTKLEIPGENGTTITVTIGDNGSGEVPNDNLPKTNVPGKGTVTEPNKKPSKPVDVTTPARKTPTLDVERDPKTGDVTVTPKKPDGSTYPPGTKVEIPGENGTPIEITIGEDGKGKVPNDKLPKKEVPGIGKITEPGKPTVEVPNVTTPGKYTPETPETEQPGKIEITQQPNGNVIVTPKKPDGSTYPPGTKVEIPGENGTTITVTIGDNGSGEVPNDKLPKKDITGTGTVTEPNKKPSKPVNVTTPARKTPTVDVEQDPKTGDVTVTPKKPDGSTYPPGTKVEIPGKDGNPITVTIGEDGKGKVPNSDLPDGKVPGTAKITEPGQPTVEVPVETPAKVTPETPETEQPGKIEITQQPNGNVIVTPKKPDGSTYPPGTKVEIPGENGTTITVTIGDNGSGEVPNDKLPKKDTTGTGTVTEPNKKPSKPVNVTTPARKTPTIDVEQDPKTGDVTVTPKKPDGSTYPPGTKVEIPGKDGNPIIVTIDKEGKGKVPNSELPDGKVPGTAKITEPGQPTVEVPNVITPAKVTPNVPTKPVEPTKRLANTGTTETNTGLAGLGLGILGGLLAVARRRKNDKN